MAFRIKQTYSRLKLAQKYLLYFYTNFAEAHMKLSLVSPPHTPNKKKKNSCTFSMRKMILLFC